MNRIASTIIDQIGERTLIASKAHSVITGENNVTVRIGDNGRHYVTVTLDSDDTYTVGQFDLTKLNKITNKSAVSGIYAGQLAEQFTLAATK